MKMNIKKFYLIISVINTILGFVFKLGYRSYIYQNNINDFGIADSAPNFFYVIGIIFLILYIQKDINKFKNVSTILSCTAGALIYELEQNYTHMMFDIKDVIATILGGIICYFLCEYIAKRYTLKYAKEQL